jgi:hypothetical protein
MRLLMQFQSAPFVKASVTFFSTSLHLTIFSSTLGYFLFLRFHMLKATVAAGPSLASAEPVLSEIRIGTEADPFGGGALGEFDALGAFEEDPDAAVHAAVTAAVALQVPASANVGDTVYVTVSANPPSDPYPPLPCGGHVGGRWAMGCGHVIISVTAAITVQSRDDGSESGKDHVGKDAPPATTSTALTSRHLDLGGKVGTVEMCEDVTASGFGTHDTHGTVWDCGVILAAFLGTDHVSAHVLLNYFDTVRLVFFLLICV